jgi:hypothetical protein
MAELWPRANPARDIINLYLPVRSHTPRIAAARTVVAFISGLAKVNSRGTTSLRFFRDMTNARVKNIS